MTKVKICGLTTLADAIAAAEAGADFLGFVLWAGSKRAAEVERVAGICRHFQQMPNRPQLVGVFVNSSAIEMAAIMAHCGLDLAQLHGEEVPAIIGDPASPLYGRSYKALRPTSLAEAEAEAEWYLPPNPCPNQPSLLIDAYHPTLRGGTGERGNWEMAAQLNAGIPGLMLAGGLTADNVAEAVTQVRPFAVDVASGVETRPGQKDYDKLNAFIQAVRQQAKDSFGHSFNPLTK